MLCTAVYIGRCGAFWRMCLNLMCYLLALHFAGWWSGLDSDARWRGGLVAERVLWRW